MGLATLAVQINKIGVVVDIICGKSSLDTDLKVQTSLYLYDYVTPHSYTNLLTKFRSQFSHKSSIWNHNNPDIYSWYAITCLKRYSAEP